MNALMALTSTDVGMEMCVAGVLFAVVALATGLSAFNDSRGRDRVPQDHSVHVQARGHDWYQPAPSVTVGRIPLYDAVLQGDTWVVCEV